MDTSATSWNIGNVIMLNVSNLNVKMANKTIVSGVSFTVFKNTFHAIIGPNGSGKTTTLRAITGDLNYTGTVEINGTDTALLKPYQLASMRAVLPQSASLSFPFTVFEVIRLGLSLGVRTNKDERY